MVFFDGRHGTAVPRSWWRGCRLAADFPNLDDQHAIGHVPKLGKLESIQPFSNFASYVDCLIQFALPSSTLAPIRSERLELTLGGGAIWCEVGGSSPDVME